MTARSRIIVWFDIDAEITVHDDNADSTIVRRVDVEIGGAILGIGRLGTASDPEIISLADRLIAAFREVRTAAVRRLNDRRAVRLDQWVCESPICPLPGSHFSGAVGCTSTSWTRPAQVATTRPTVLRTASAGRSVEHDEELHSGSPLAPGTYVVDCPACDRAWRARPRGVPVYPMDAG
jgi:hypothetical protein